MPVLEPSEIQLKGIDTGVLILMVMDGMISSMSYLLSNTSGSIKTLMDSEIMQQDPNPMLAPVYQAHQPSTAMAALT